MTKTSSKEYELKTYDEVVNNLSYGNRMREAIDEKL